MDHAPQTIGKLPSESDSYSKALLDYSTEPGRQSDPPESSLSIVASSDEDLKKLFNGIYFKDQTRSENIFLAIESGRFPTAYPVTLKNITFRVPLGETYVLPENVHLYFEDGDEAEDCTLTRGTLKFLSGKLVGTTVKAKPYANGPDAQAHNNVEGGVAWAKNGGAAYSSKGATSYAKSGARAYAADGGTSFAVEHGTIAYADGKGSRGFGLKFDTEVRLTNYAVGYRNADGVKIVKYDETRCPSRETVCRRIMSSLEDERRYNSDMRELIELSKAGDQRASTTLGLKTNVELKKFWGSSNNNPKVDFLTRAYELGSREAPRQLGDYYMQRSKLIDEPADLKEALEWYGIAREKGDTTLDEKITRIKAKLKPFDCIIS
ncbi:MAG: hypothetical protein K0R08_1175 [Solimicrobium sp.]|jgi:hypothetical protein|nr:hypothetical protein [Solimicrobium sp.]